MRLSSSVIRTARLFAMAFVGTLQRNTDDSASLVPCAFYLFIRAPRT